MTDENGSLSFDFLVGFTIFLLAFIWVVTMIPGLMIGLQSYTIDYDAVAYRTGVILVEDPGWPVSPPWESFLDPQKDSVIRFGLALSKDTPNILSQEKVNRFFCTTFIYPDDYHTRAIFGDYPYGFNISLIDLGGQNGSVGDILPDGYGYIRRLVKIKGVSNATINNATYTKYPSSYIKIGSPTNETTTHVFSILINNTKLQGDVKNPAYQIDPSREQITINITDLRSTITDADFPSPPFPPIDNITCTITLKDIKLFRLKDGGYSQLYFPPSEFPYIDGSSTRLLTMPSPVTDNITLRISPSWFNTVQSGGSQSGVYYPIYIALGFDLSQSGSGKPQNSTFLNNTQALPNFDTLDPQLTFNNPNTTPFDYDYEAENVTQPQLRDAVLEIAVWGGGATTTGGAGTPATGSHTIQAAVGNGGGGTISPIGSVNVNDGDDQLFTITPNTGYHITDVVVDGVSKGIIPSYTFNNVDQDHSIVASFAIDTFTITPSAGPHGAISPGTPRTVNYGSTPTFTFTPAPGYLATATVDGVPVALTGNTYTFPAVTADHTINALFSPLPPTFTSITPNSGPIVGGTPVTIVGSNFVSGGSFGVTIGGAAATSVVWVDTSHITAVTPAGTAGVQTVVITNNDGQFVTGVGAYTYV
jgi:hypothetical protein